MTETLRVVVRALTFAAVVALAALSINSASAQPAPSGDRFQGFLTAVTGDPHPSVAGGETRFTITYPDGTHVPLDVGPDLQSEAFKNSGQRVTVHGSASAESGTTRIRVESIESAETAPRVELAGTKKVLFILLKFKGDAQTPHPASFFTKLTNPLTPSAGIPATINGFFDKVSYGKFKWQGTVAGNKWYTLPKTRAQYCMGNCGPSGADINLDLIGDNAMTLVAGDVNVNLFDNVNFVLNNDLDCCAWGGQYSNGMTLFGATWEPPWGQETGVYVHEMGHSLGLPHSGWRYYAYDSHHDQMSRGHAASTVQCGTYNSVNFGGLNTAIFCDEPGGGYIGVHQNFLGWIPPANKKTHNFGVGVVKNYTIEANSVALGSNAKLLIICITGKPCSGGEGSAARFVTVEVKLQAGQFDNGVPSEGVIIHDVLMNRRNTISGNCFFNNQNGWAIPFDAMPGDFNSGTCSPQDQANTGLLNMAYGVGKTFNSAQLGVKVQVISKTGNTFKVRVTKTK